MPPSESGGPGTTITTSLIKTSFLVRGWGASLALLWGQTSHYSNTDNTHKSEF